MRNDGPAKPAKNARQVARVRKICATFPETFEKLSHGEPTFFVRKKVFAMLSNNHHDDGHVAVLVPAAIGIQAKLIEAAPEKFYRPPYVGVRGWVGIELSQVSDEELALHISEAWKLIAPQKVQDAVEDPETQAAKEYKIPSQRKAVKRRSGKSPSEIRRKRQNG